MKKTLEDLHIFGGSKEFQDPLHVGFPNPIDLNEFIARIREIYGRNWLTNNGPNVLQLEDRICEILEVRNCVAVCNGTAALELVIKACNLSGEVIVPSFTFIATAHALDWLGIKPVFCDIDPDTHSIDPHKIRDLITPSTTGIIGVHLWGNPCRIDDLQSIADEKELVLLFDAAHAFMSRSSDKYIGGFGEAEIFSLHATKFVNSSEGGLITTNSDELAGKLRLLRNFGFAGYDKVVGSGINAKMSELAAAAGITALESLNEYLKRNRENYRRYMDLLSGIDGLNMLKLDTNASNCQYVIVEIDGSSADISRDAVMNTLWQENVRARRYFYPGCHRSEPYSSLCGNNRELPVTEILCDKVLCLPTGMSVGPGEIERICSIIGVIMNNGSGVTDQLSSLSSETVSQE